jgi:flagellar hook-basal body complex protein FliE
MGPISFQAAPYVQAMRANEMAPHLEKGTIDIPAVKPGALGVHPGEGAVGIKSGASFENVLGQMVREVNARQGEAARQVQGVLAGEGVPLHQAVIAMEEASISFQLMVEVRNKLLESYQEIMRMQI